MSRRKQPYQSLQKKNITRLYQFNHPNIEEVKMVKRWSEKTTHQIVIFNEMKTKASEIESMGQIACIVAKMLEVQINDHPIKLLNQKFAHFDDGFHKSEFQGLFGYLFGCGVEVDIPPLVKDENGKVVWQMLD